MKNACDEIMQSYNENVRFLKTYSINYPGGKAFFSLPLTFYTSRNLKHITAVELRICLNQALYSVIKDFTDSKLWSVDISYNSFADVMDESFLITAINSKFRKLIEKKTFSVDIKLLSERRLNNLFLTTFSYNFENGSSYGTIDSVIKLKGNEIA